MAISRELIEESRRRVSLDAVRIFDDVGRSKSQQELFERFNSDVSWVEKFCYGIELLHLESVLNIRERKKALVGQLMSESDVKLVVSICEGILAELNVKPVSSQFCDLWQDLFLAKAALAIGRGRFVDAAINLQHAGSNSRRGVPPSHLLPFYRAEVALNLGYIREALDQCRQTLILTDSASVEESVYVMALRCARVLEDRKSFKELNKGIENRPWYTTDTQCVVDFERFLLNNQTRWAPWLRSDMPEVVVDAHLWCRATYGTRSNRKDLPLVKSRTLKERYGRLIDVEPRLRSRIYWIGIFEDLYDRSVPLVRKLEQIGVGLEKELDPLGEGRLVVLSGLKKWALTYNQRQVCVLIGALEASAHHAANLVPGDDQSERLHKPLTRDKLPGRTIGVSRLVGRVGTLYLRQKTRRFFRTHTRQHVEDDLVALGMILKKELGHLKGPLLKFGQMMGMWSSNIPEELQTLLLELTDDVEPLPFFAVEKTLIKEWGKDWQQKFKVWHDTPIGAASIGQVHAGVLQDGREVIVKIQYPDIRGTIKKDLGLLKLAIPVLKRIYPAIDFDVFMEELSSRLLEETDYRLEARNQKQFGEMFADWQDVVVPEIVEDLTTEKVLVSERVHGQSYGDFLASNDQPTIDRAAKTIHSVTVHSIFRYGFFNADPHPGNFLFMNEKVAFIDFGCVKQWSEQFMDNWRALVRSTLERNREANAEAWRRMGYVGNNEKFDFDWQFRFFARTIYRPFLTSEILPIMTERTESEFQDALLDNKNRTAMAFPGEHVMALRLTSGTAALLRRMGTKLNWREAVIPIMYGEDDEIPEEFSHEQLMELEDDREAG